MTTTRRRLDVELVRRGVVATRAAAQDLVASKRVTVGGAVATKAGRMVSPAEAVLVAGDPPRFVGRGGEKLDAALERFGVDVAGRRALDAGSSTGGFTDCLLQRGASEVVALDVGTNQLHERLRADARVAVHEQTNLRHVTPANLGRFAIVVADLSFISLLTVADAVLALAEPGAAIVLLVKPQFEAGRQVVSRGRGVVRDPFVHAEVVETVATGFASRGAAIMGAMVSPLRGAEGNVEFLLSLRAPGATHSSATLSPSDVRAVALAEEAADD